MIANVLIEIYRNSGAINVWMVIYVMIICENPNLYMEHGGQDDGYKYLQNCYLHFEHAG